MPIRDPDFDPPASSLKDAADSESVAATASLACGIIAMFAWLLPPVGLLAGFAGLLLGHQGWHAPNRDRARVGVALSIIALIMSLWLAGWIIIALKDVHL